MKTKVFGKKIENVYEVDCKWKTVQNEQGEYVTVFTDKPTLTKIPTVREWAELCAFDGEPRYNKGTKANSSNPFAILNFSFKNRINVTEDEEVCIDEEIFRADLNELHLHTDKIVEETDLDKEGFESDYENQIKAFNKMMIESNNKLMTYCDLHKLSYEDTDAIKLFKLVFPDEEYVIEDGVMKVKEKTKVIPNVYGNICVNGDIATLSTASDICCTSISSAISSRC